MKITRQKVAQVLIDYLHRDIALSEMVDWAESVMMEADFERHDLEVLRDIVGRIGLADVRAFGMTWEDCEGFLSQLGYQVRIEIEEKQALS